MASELRAGEQGRGHEICKTQLQRLWDFSFTAGPVFFELTKCATLHPTTPYIVKILTFYWGSLPFSQFPYIASNLLKDLIK